MAKASQKNKKNVPVGLVKVSATFNNTIVTVTDLEGNTLAQSSPGAVGFKGSKRSTAFAATKAAQEVAMNVKKKYGMREVKVYLKGAGAGRNASVKGLDAAGLRVTLLVDKTPVPHNGCRPRKMPRK